MRSTSRRLGLRDPRRNKKSARVDRVLDPLTDSEQHRLFAGEASNLYGGSGPIPNLDDIEGEFEFEDPPEHSLWKPEWAAWLRYSQAKFDLATEHLRFVEVKDDLYHYVDRRDGGRYSIPTREEWDRYQVEDVQMHIDYGGRPKFWKRVIKYFLLACGLMLLLAFFLSVNAERAATGLPDAVARVALVALLVGTPMLFLIRHVSLPSPRSMPEHVMFYTPVEQAEIDARDRYERARNVAIFAGIMGFFAARRFARHFQEED